MRRGRRMVKEWATALCSLSGATTQTSSDRLRATSSSTLMPGASIPSSLLTRMRARERSIGLGIRGSDALETGHIGAQHFGNDDRAVGLLIVLQHRDQGAPDRQARAVQRMEEAGRLFLL